MDQSFKNRNFDCKILLYFKDEIYPSSYAAAYYIKYVAKLCGKVYVLGAPGLVEELENENIEHIGSGVVMFTI